MEEEPQLSILKHYRYRGVPVAVRRIGEKFFEYLFVYKGDLYTNYFWFNEEDLDNVKSEAPNADSRLGAVTWLICNSAEGHVDQIKKRKSLLYKYIGKYFEPKVAKLTEENKNE